MVSQFAMKARRCTYVSPHIRQRLVHLFFSVESREMSSKKLHILIDAYKAPASASPFFFCRRRQTPCKNATSSSWWVLSCFLRMASELNEVLHKNLSPFCRKYCTIKVAPCLLFHCRQKLLVILHYSKHFKLKQMRNNQNMRKMYKII